MSNYFDGIKSPEDFVEIGQPTFVELISASVCNTSPAIRRIIPKPSDSLRRVAFGKPCSVSTENHDALSIEPQFSTFKVSSAKFKTQAVNKGIINDEFRSIVSNVSKQDVTSYNNQECPEDYDLISYENWDDRISDWAGGLYDSINKWLIVPSPRNQHLHDPFSYIVVADFSKGLKSGDKVKLTFEVIKYEEIFIRRTNFRIVFRDPFSPVPLLDMTLDSEYGTKELELTLPRPEGCCNPDQEFPYNRINIQIINVGNLAFPNGSPGAEYVPIDDIRVCVKRKGNGQIDDQQCKINNVSVSFEWEGIIRNPVNLFGCVIQYTARSRSEPYENSRFRYLPSSEGRRGLIGCDLWKSATGSGKVLQNYPIIGTGNGILNEITSGSVVDITKQSDWLWAIPQDNNNTIQDAIVASFPGVNLLIESVEIFFLVNSVKPKDGTETSPVYPSPLTCTPDPTNELNVSIRYVDGEGLSKEFTYQMSDFYIQEVDYAGVKWDSDKPIGFGIKGSEARWESVSFKLDMLDGSGLDQCTTPVSFNASGSGNLSIKNPKIYSNNHFIEPCDAEVIVEDISSADSVNEVQSIEMPISVDGTWDLSFTKNETTRTTLPWNANANEINDALALLPNINGAKNIKVTGNGTKSTPFLVEFTGDLAGVDHEMLEADGGNLIPPGGSRPINTLEDGTKNERQTIINRSANWPDDTRPYTNFWRIATGPPGPGTQTTNPIPFNASLNRIQAELERLSWQGISGTGNISVTGNIIDRDMEYPGPYTVDFINALGNTNIDQMYVIPQWVSGIQNGYTVVTNIDGITGRNERQQLFLTGEFSNVFNLKIFNQDGIQFFNVNSIPFNIDDSALESLISSAPGSFLTTPNDLHVRTVRIDPDVKVIERIFEFGYVPSSAYRGINMPPIQVSYNSSGLNITVKEVQKGSGSNDRQRITVLRASGGSFKLNITVNGKDHTTAAIPWNTTAEGIQSQLIALRPFQIGDLTVKELPKTNEEQNIRAAVTFKKSFGNLPLMIPDFQNTLLCNPLILPVVPPPPPLVVPDCEENLGCSSGPLLCKPSFEDDIEVEPCCNSATISQSANFSSRIKIERDLFDPKNGITIKGLASMKGVKISNYTPYIRDWNTGRLIETTYETSIMTKMSIILIEKPLDTSSGRARVMVQVSKNEILPSRFVWPN